MRYEVVTEGFKKVFSCCYLLRRYTFVDPYWLVIIQYSINAFQFRGCRSILCPCIMDLAKLSLSGYISCWRSRSANSASEHLCSPALQQGAQCLKTSLEFRSPTTGAEGFTYQECQKWLQMAYKSVRSTSWLAQIVQSPPMIFPVFAQKQWVLKFPLPPWRTTAGMPEAVRWVAPNKDQARLVAVGLPRQWRNCWDLWLGVP